MAVAHAQVQRPTASERLRATAHSATSAAKGAATAGMPAYLGYVQLKCDECGAGPDPESAHAHRVAARGVAQASAPLPEAGRIQAAFGHHDISSARAQVDGPAAGASRDLGASAYTLGDRIGFAAQPDLRLAAHEAAHVVQQRGGVHLDRDVGRSGDPYERHADAVAELVVRGESAEALLDTMAHGGAAGGPAVQREDRNGDGIDDVTGLPVGGRAGAAPAARLSATQHIALLGADNAPEVVARQQWLIDTAHIPRGASEATGETHPDLFREIVALFVARYTWANRESAEAHIADMRLTIGAWSGQELTFSVDHSIYGFIGLPPDAPVQAFRDQGGLTIYADTRHLYPESVSASAPATHVQRRAVAEQMITAFEREVGGPMDAAERGRFLGRLSTSISSLRDTQGWHLSADDLIVLFGEDAGHAYLGRASAGDPGSSVLQLGTHSYVLPSDLTREDIDFVRRMLTEVHGSPPAPGAGDGEPLTRRDVEALRLLDTDPDRADIMRLLHAAMERGRLRPPRAAAEPEPFVHESGLASTIETAREMLDRTRSGARLHLPAEGSRTSTESPYVARPVRGEIVNRTGRINTDIEAHFAFQTLDRVPILAVPHVNINWYAYRLDGESLVQVHSSSTGDLTDIFADVDDYTVTFRQSGLYEIHAFVNHSFYYPAHFQIPVEVLSQEERLEQQEAETAATFGRLDSGRPAAAYTFAEVDREDRATSIAVAAALAVSAGGVAVGPSTPLLTPSDNAVGTRATGTLADGMIAGFTSRAEVAQINTDVLRLSRLIDTLPQGDPTRVAAQARIERLEAARIAIESGGVDDTAHSIELQAFFATRTEHIPDAALRLTAVFRRDSAGHYSGEMWDTTEHQRAEIFHFRSGSHSTYASMMEALFIDLTQAYADGTISFSFQNYESEGAVGVRATRSFTRFTRVTDTLAEDIHDIFYSTPVQVAVGIASVLLMLFPPTAPIGIGVSFLYNAGQVTWDLGADLNTDTLDRGNAIDVGLLILDLIPILGRASRVGTVGSRVYWTIEIIGDAGDLFLAADSTYREMLLVRDQEAQRCADTYAELEHLRSTNAADESGIRALEERLTRERQALIDRSYEVLAEAAAQQLMIRATHAAVRRLAEPHLTRRHGGSGDANRHLPPGDTPPPAGTRPPVADTRPPTDSDTRPPTETRPAETEPRSEETDPRSADGTPDGTPPPSAAPPAVVLTERERFAASEWDRLHAEGYRPSRRRDGTRMTREEFIVRMADGQELTGTPRRWTRPGGREVAPDHRFTTETPTQVLTHLREGTFGSYERMLRRMGLVDEAAMLARVAAMGTSGRTETVVRHELKAQFGEVVMARLTGVSADGTPVPGHRAEVQARHPDLDWAGDPDGAYAAGRHLNFLRETNDIGPADKGNLYEVFDRVLHREGTGAIPHPHIARSALGGTGPNRVPDNLIPVESSPGHVILHDDKNLTTPLSPHALSQMTDYRTLPGRPIDIEVNGTVRNVIVDEVMVTFPDPRGVQANVGNIREQLRLMGNREGLTFEIFSWGGRRATIPGDLPRSFTDAELATFLGPAPEWECTSGTVAED